MEIQCHDVNDSYVKGEIDVVKIDTECKIADILTKSLGNPKFVKSRELLKFKLNYQIIKC